MTELALAVFASETGTHLMRPPLNRRWSSHLRSFDASAYEQRLAAARLSLPCRAPRPSSRRSFARSTIRRPASSCAGGRGRLLSRAAVAVVGARACSGYGASVARSLGRDLAAAGLVVVSGMARGIDAEAHRGALEAGGPTVAVLGCGIDRDYPAAHAELARRIAATGLLVSEYAPGVEPAPWRFPARNRIVAGLCAATVVVEARERSGALITADLALEEGREVFTVPGEISSALSAGTNALLKLGATPLTAASDVLQSFGIEEAAAGRPRRAPRPPAGHCRRARPPHRQAAAEIARALVELELAASAVPRMRASTACSDLPSA